MDPPSAVGPAKQVTVIDEYHRQGPIAVLEDGLTVVAMFRADIHHPRQPNLLQIANLAKSAFRQDLDQPARIVAQETGSKGQSRGRPQVLRFRLQPACSILIEECVRDPDGGPFRNGQAACPVKLRPHAFVEENIGPLEVVGEFDDVEQAVVCLGKNCL